MKFLLPEDPINLYKQGFEAEDLLDRKKVGQALSDLVERIEDPIVVALDGQWGTGKSYFLQRWVGAHSFENDGRARTVYFDAFANDYLSDPLPAIVSALTERFSESEPRRLERVKAAAFKAVKPVTRLGLSIVTSGATEVLNSMGDAVVTAVGDEATTALEEFWKREASRRSAIEEFKEAINSLLTDDNSEDSDLVGAGLVIVVDELDRCRPDYALEILEVIKHFFEVPRVHFVLGVNMKALENSVIARYGTGIDAEAYLKKFINISLSLPDSIGSRHTRAPASSIYLNNLMVEMGTPDHLAVIVKEHIEMMQRTNPISLREMGKIVSALSLVHADVLENKELLRGWLDVLVTLVIAKVVHPTLFPELLNSSVQDSELLDFFGATFETVTPKTLSEMKDEVDRRTFIAVMRWRFISGDGEIENGDSELERFLRRDFDSHGIVHDAKNIPRLIYKKWLDIFEFHSH